MMTSTICKIRNRVSEYALYQGVKEISSFHRIQASTGFRAAAEFLQKKLQGYGIESRILSFPADGKTWYYCSRMFKEWDCKAAWLKNAETGEVYADFAADPISVIQRSYPCDYRDNALDLVYIAATKPLEAYRELDLKGKLIFYQGPLKDVHHWAIREKGAVGIVTDCIYEAEGIRTRHDLYDIKNYTSFWWKHDGKDDECFGYVLTPREGDKLAGKCKEYMRKHEEDPSHPAYPKMYCFMDSSLYEGKMEVVEAVLPGQTKEEILLVAHLCHPRASANDNASGVSAVTEALRTLKNMIEQGDLPPLKRGIRAIFVPEFTGIYPWLQNAGSNRCNVKAGLNLDMVGGAARKGYGPVTLSGIPDCCQSLAVSMAELVLDELYQVYPTHSGLDFVSNINRGSTEFDPGSDNYILCDPTVNIPTPMFGQWPDPNYHTSGDTLETIDPEVLKVSSSLAAGYAYLYANLNSDTAAKLLEKSVTRFQERLFKQLKPLSGTEKDPGLCAYLLEIYEKRMANLRTFFEEDTEEGKRVNKISEQAIAMVRAICESLPLRECEGEEEGDPRGHEIWERLYVTPISHTDDHFKGDEKRYEYFQEYVKNHRSKMPHAYRTEAIVQYEMNGQNTVDQIVQLVSRQSGKTRDEVRDFVYAYIQLLKELELARKKEKV